MEKRICKVTEQEIDDKYTIRTVDGHYVLREYYHNACMCLKKGLVTLKEIIKVNNTKIKLREAIQTLVLYIRKADLEHSKRYLDEFMHKENLFNIEFHSKSSECCDDEEHLEFIEAFMELAPEDNSTLEYNEPKDALAMITKYIKYNKIIL